MSMDIKNIIIFLRQHTYIHILQQERSGGGGGSDYGTNEVQGWQVLKGYSINLFMNDRWRLIHTYKKQKQNINGYLSKKKNLNKTNVTFLNKKNNI